MSNKKYIYIAEVSSEDDSMNITPKLVNMNFFEKFIMRLFTPLREEIKESLKALELKNKELEKLVSDLSQKLSLLSDKVNQNGEKTEALLADYNTKKASMDSKYKAAIDALYKLNIKFSQNVRRFGEANKLNIIQMLVHYLYNPTNDEQDTIMAAACGDERTLSILKDIDDFNTSLKPDLIKYLDTIEKKWQDCVLFPNEYIYKPSTMQPYNDEIEEGSPIYVVSLGYKFPNSNSEEQQPMVYIRKG